MKLKCKEYFFLFLIVFLLNSCSSNKWRMRNYQELSQIIQTDTSVHILVDFSPIVSTDKYGLSLFFPDVKFKPYKADGIEDSILQSLDGFELKVYEKGKNNLLAEKEINYKRYGFRGNFFLEADILELGVSGRLSVDKSKSYKIEMTIPPKKYSDKRLETIILGGGQPPNVYP